VEEKDQGSVGLIPYFSARVESRKMTYRLKHAKPVPAGFKGRRSGGRTEAKRA
jgi:hypothetical protein